MRAQHGRWATEASPCSEHSVWRPQPSPTVRMLPPAVPFLGKPRHLPATFLSQPQLSQGCSSHPFRHPLELEGGQSSRRPRARAFIWGWSPQLHPLSRCRLAGSEGRADWQAQRAAQPGHRHESLPEAQAGAHSLHRTASRELALLLWKAAGYNVPTTLKIIIAFEPTSLVGI